LLLRLLGSRKNNLFCGGQKGSVDEKIYNTLLPGFTITPVEFCFNVISYTKVFNKVSNLIMKVLGLIDSDYHETDRLEKLKSDNVFSFSTSEPENLFLDELFLDFLTKKLLVHNKNVVQNIKVKVMSQLRKNMELRISNYVSMKINYYFTYI
jgi:hypothetical protein